MDYIPDGIIFDDKQRNVPGLHPGLNDLIRVLDKQAHCASRTLILCEPYIPSVSGSKYHRNCNSPTRRKSLESISRPSSLWAPCSSSNYYYDCFSYKAHLERDQEYKSIEEAYNVLTQKDLNYSPPECVEGAKRSHSSHEKALAGDKQAVRVFAQDQKSKSKTSQKPYDSYQKPSTVHSDQLKAKSSRSNFGDKSSAKLQSLVFEPDAAFMQPNRAPQMKKTERTMLNKEGSVTCAELAEIRDLIRTSDDNNFRKLQEVLLLMKELSTREFCRAACDKVHKRHSEAEVVKEGSFMDAPPVKGVRASKSLESFSDTSEYRRGKLNASKTQLGKATSSSGTLGGVKVESVEDLRVASSHSVRETLKPASSSEASLKGKKAQMSAIHSDKELRQVESTPAAHEQMITIGNTSMTVRELVELSSLITDIIVIESVKGMMNIGKYFPPSKRSHPERTLESQHQIRGSKEGAASQASRSTFLSVDSRKPPSIRDFEETAPKLGTISEKDHESRSLENMKSRSDRSNRRSVEQKVAGSSKKQGHPKHPKSSCRMKELDQQSGHSPSVSISSEQKPGSSRVASSKRGISPCNDREPTLSKFSSGKPEHRGYSSHSGPGRESITPSVCTKEDTTACTDYYKDDTILYFAKITNNAYCPEKESYNAPGFMLKSAYDYVVPPRGQIGIKTDLLLELPRGSYGRLAPRKCLAMNFGIDVGADVLDRDFKENVTVLLFNHSDKPFPIKRGNKVAQLICERVHHATAKENLNLIKT